jgi:hypothetical protein
MGLRAQNSVHAFSAISSAAFLAACAGSKGSPDGVATTVSNDSSSAIVLGCEDAAIDVKLPGRRGLRVGGIAFDFAVMRGGEPVLHAGKDYLFFKDPIYDARQSGFRTTVTLLSPPPARLYYAGSATWSAGPSDKEIVTAARRRLTVASCRDQLVDQVGYLGGFLVPSRSCVTVEVKGSNGGAARTVKIALGVGAC